MRRSYEGGKPEGVFKSVHGARRGNEGEMRVEGMLEQGGGVFSRHTTEQG